MLCWGICLATLHPQRHKRRTVVPSDTLLWLMPKGAPAIMGHLDWFPHRCSVGNQRVLGQFYYLRLWTTRLWKGSLHYAGLQWKQRPLVETTNLSLSSFAYSQGERLRPGWCPFLRLWVGNWRCRERQSDTGTTLGKQQVASCSTAEATGALGSTSHLLSQWCFPRWGVRDWWRVWWLSRSCPAPFMWSCATLASSEFFSCKSFLLSWFLVYNCEHLSASRKCSWEMFSDGTLCPSVSTQTGVPMPFWDNIRLALSPVLSHYLRNLRLPTIHFLLVYLNCILSTWSFLSIFEQDGKAQAKCNGLLGAYISM